jgi:enoyl-CoA hydratase
LSEEFRMSQVLYEVRDETAYLTIDRPEQRNALSASVIEGLRFHIDQAARDATARALVITGSGDQFFSAGGDLAEVRRSLDDPVAAQRNRWLQGRMAEDLQLCGKPTIARVCGPAIGAGFGLALACDFIVATDKTYFSLPEVLVGLWPYSITTPLLQSMTPRRALQLMLTGGRIDMDEASALGLAYEVTTSDEIDERVDSLLRRLRKGSPQAVALGRTAFYRAAAASGGAGEAVYEQALTAALALPDSQEGMTSFVEKRQPGWL